MLIGQSPQVQKIRKMIREIAKTNDPVLLIGEVGVGKSMVASEIHRKSKQKNKPFVTINCTGIQKDKSDGDLFGEQIDGPQGIERKIGLLEQANKGILYLENADELVPEYQQHFLNIIKDHKFFKPTENSFTDINIRIISATSDPDIAKNGNFRKDLLAELSTFTINIPPLREHKQDIPLLFSQFLERYCEEFEHDIPPVPADIFESLMEYEWTGNVSELRNAVRNLILMSPEGELSVEYLPFEVKKHPFETLLGRDLPDAISEVERYLIKKALRKFAGNQTKAAHALNVSEAALRYKMKKYGLTRKTF